MMWLIFNTLANSSPPKRDVILSDRGNALNKATSSYPINDCPQPWWPDFSYFMSSFCAEEDLVSWFLVCTSPGSNYVDDRVFKGQCPEGYMCENHIVKPTDENPPTAWCVGPGYDTFAASPNSASVDSGSVNGSSENSNSENGDFEDSNSGNSSSGSSSSGSSSSGNSGSGYSLKSFIRRMFPWK